MAQCGLCVIGTDGKTTASNTSAHVIWFTINMICLHGMSRRSMPIVTSSIWLISLWKVLLGSEPQSMAPIWGLTKYHRDLCCGMSTDKSDVVHNRDNHEHMRRRWRQTCSTWEAERMCMNSVCVHVVSSEIPACEFDWVATNCHKHGVGPFVCFAILSDRKKVPPRAEW